MKVNNLLYIAIIVTFILFGCSSETVGPTDEEERFTKSIERLTSNDFEKSLIEKAELAYLPRDSVIKDLEEEWPFIIDDLPETGYWYWRYFDGVKLPYSITIHAIDYYVEFIRNLQQDDEQEFYKNASFEYEAFVTYESYIEIYELGHQPSPEYFLDSFENVYVVNMSMIFRYECFIHCFLSSGKDRLVIFDTDGNMLGIYYDGITPSIVK
jgi:hypothetical protein